MPKLLYIQDGTLPRYRVWRDDWSGDQFEVLSAEDFNKLNNMCKRFSILLEEHFDEDEG